MDSSDKGLSHPNKAGEKVRVGVIGVGRMGRLHLVKYLELPSCEVVGFFDPDSATRQLVQAEYGVRSFETLQEILFEADAVTIAAPTRTHYELGRRALEAGVHVLMEKPITRAVSEASELVHIASTKGLVLLAGFIERFRFTRLASNIDISSPIYIEATRFATAPGREADVDVVMDLMIHDIDLILSLNQNEPHQISAWGVSVTGGLCDVAGASLEFPDGMVAQLRASRVALQRKREIRVFRSNRYHVFDLQGNEVCEVVWTAKKGPQLTHTKGEAADPLLDQCSHFVSSVIGDNKTLSDRSAGLRSLRTALLVSEQVSKRMRGTYSKDAKVGHHLKMEYRWEHKI